MLMQYPEYLIYIIKHFVFLKYFQNPGGTHHVAQIPAPDGIDPAALCKTVVFHFIYPFIGKYTTDLCFFPESKYIRFDSVVLLCPHLARYAHSALYLIENEHYVVFVTDGPKLPEEFRPEVIVTSLFKKFPIAKL
jgi:hypothetical protein